MVPRFVVFNISIYVCMHVYTRVVYVCRCSRHDVQLAERVSIKFLIDSKKYFFTCLYL